MYLKAIISHAFPAENAAADEGTLVPVPLTFFTSLRSAIPTRSPCDSGVAQWQLLSQIVVLTVQPILADRAESVQNHGVLKRYYRMRNV